MAMLGASRYPESRGRFFDGISVTHPNELFALHSLKQAIVFFNSNSRGAVLPEFAPCHHSTKRLRHQLHAIADPKDWDSAAEKALIAARSILGVDAGRASA